MGYTKPFLSMFFSMNNHDKHQIVANGCDGADDRGHCDICGTDTLTYVRDVANREREREYQIAMDKYKTELREYEKEFLKK
jgi:hypothetical protein